MIRTSHIRLYILIIFIINSTLLAQIEWERFSGPKRGSIISMTVDRNDILYATIGENGGVFKLLPDHNSWEQITPKDDLGNINRAFSRSEIASAGNELYVLASPGLYRSTDGGTNWSEITILESGYFNQIYGRDLQITNDGNLFITKGDGLYLSTDKGLSWNKIYNRDYRIQFTITKNGNIYVIISNDKIIRSSDNGITWTTISSPTLDGYHQKLFINNIGNLILSIDQFIWYSNDDGVTWTNTKIADDKFSWINYFSQLEDGTIYAAKWSYGIYGVLLKSQDNGITWVNSNFINYTVACIAEVKNNIYLGTTEDKDSYEYYGEGIFTSSDRGMTWSSLNDGFFNSEVYSLLFTSNNNIIIGSTNKVYTSTDMGNTWFPTLKDNHPGVKNPTRQIIEINESIIYLSNQKGIYKSLDYGLNWELFLELSGIKKFVFQEDGSLIISASNLGLLISYDEGKNWKELIPPSLTPRDFITNKFSYIFAVLGGKYYSGVFRSFNRNDSLFAKTSLDNDFITSIVMDDKENIYVLSGRYWDYQTGDYNQLYNEIYYSSDYGDNWSWFSNDFTSREFGHKLYTTGGKYIFSIGYDEIFMLKGIKWLDVSEGLNLNYRGYHPNGIYCVTSSASGKIFIGTSDGIFSSKKIVTDKESIIELPSNFHLEQNYPNPFNPTTKISYSISDPGHVRLDIYDILGRLITTLVDDNKPTGNYSVYFDGSQLSSGIYLYKIEVKNYSETKKMLIVK